MLSLVRVGQGHFSPVAHSYPPCRWWLITGQFINIVSSITTSRGSQLPGDLFFSFTACYCFPPSFCFSHPTFSSIPPLQDVTPFWPPEPQCLPNEDDGGGYLFHLGLKQGQRNIKWQQPHSRAKCNPARLNNHISDDKVLYDYVGFVAFGFSPLRSYADFLTRYWPIFTSILAPRSAVYQASYNF